MSAIDIPPDSDWDSVNHPGSKLMHDHNFRSLLDDPGHPLRAQLLDHLARKFGLTTVEVERVLFEQGNSDPYPQDPGGSTGDIAPEEWAALCAPRDHHDHRDQFISRRASRPAPRDFGDGARQALAAVLADVVLVDRLREVRVLTGFQRYKMGAMVSSNLAVHANFKPAVEVFGEGFFVRFNEGVLAEWESRDEVKSHCARLAVRKHDNARWLEVPPTPRYVLLHTIAHLLLRQTAFEAGYSTSSLRERLYVTGETGRPAMAGILIYTAAGDTEGTLGGLVRLGEYERLTRIFLDAVSTAQWCSFDPVCMESPGQGPGGLSLAACHACALVPETSCTTANRLLDRRLVVDQDLGFLSGLVSALGRAPGIGVP